MKRIIGIVAVFVLLVSLTACGGAGPAAKPFDTKAENGSVSETLIAENDRLRLEWDDTSKGVILTELADGKQWGVAPIAEGGAKLDDFGMPVKRHPKLESALLVSYLDYETNTVIDTVSLTGAIENGRVRCARGKDSLLVEFYFDGPNFMIPVQYILKKDHLQIRIDTDKIEEEKNKVISVSVAPFLCSAENDSAESYLFVPSGSGTLIRPTTLSQQGATYSSPVYGEDFSEEKIAETTEGESIRLPVFGVRSAADSGMFAVIGNGADSSVIDVLTGASIYGYSTVFPTFRLRGSTHHTAKLFSGIPVENVVFSRGKIGGTLSVDYYPLTGKDADYSGMARLYRGLLEKQDDLPGNCTDSPLNVTLLGGMMVTDSFCGIPYERLCCATTVAQAEDIVKELSEDAGLPFQIVLKGFGTTGVNVGQVAGGFRMAKQFGSAKEWRRFRDLCKKNAQGLYFDFDLVRFSRGGKGFSVFSDACANAGEQKAVQYLYNIAVNDQEKETRHYLLNPAAMNGAGQKMIAAAKRLGLDGVSLASLSSMSYSDYSDKTDARYYSKNGTGKAVTDVLKQVAGEKLKLASESANVYAAVRSDLILNAPVQSDAQHIFYADIPFYEMVFKGHVPLSVGALNLCADRELRLLQAVEGGMGLGYTLIGSWNGDMIVSDYPLFYNSVCSDVKKELFADTARLSGYYEKVAGAEILSHEIVSEQLRKTVFSNGVTVYVNYGGTSVQTAAGTVKGRDYLVTEGSIS